LSKKDNTILPLPTAVLQKTALNNVIQTSIPQCALQGRPFPRLPVHTYILYYYVYQKIKKKINFFENNNNFADAEINKLTLTF